MGGVGADVGVISAGVSWNGNGVAGIVAGVVDGVIVDHFSAT